MQRSKLRTMTAKGIRHTKEYIEGRKAKVLGLGPDNEYESFSPQDSAFMAGYHSCSNKM